MSSPGLDVLDERLAGRPGVHGYDPLRLAVDVRGTGSSGYEVADFMRRRDDINLELAAEAVVVAVFGMGETAHESPGAPGDSAAPRDRRARRGWAHAGQLHPPAAGLGAARDDAPRRRSSARRRPCRWRRRSGRIASESLAAYPPGIPNVLPGERITA